MKVNKDVKTMGVMGALIGSVMLVSYLLTGCPAELGGTYYVDGVSPISSGSK